MSQAIEPVRHPGQWKPGQSGHPGGRPKTAKTITDALRRLVEKGEGDRIAKELIRLAKEAKQEAVRVKASEMVTDRLEGRPMQAIAMLQVMDDNTANRLVQLASILTGNQLPPISLEAQTVENAPAQPSQLERKKSKNKRMVE